MGLSKIEQETIIIYNNAESTAIVETCHTKLMNKLLRYSEEFPDMVKKLGEVREGDSCECMRFSFPKKYIALRTPRPRQISEEHRQKLASAARFLKSNDGDIEELDEEYDEEEVEDE